MELAAQRRQPHADPGVLGDGSLEMGDRLCRASEGICEQTEVLLDRKTLTTAYPELTFSGGRGSRERPDQGEDRGRRGRVRGRR